MALLPVSGFNTNNEVNYRAIEEFIRALDEMTVAQTFGNLLITVHISESADLIEALKLMRSKRVRRVAVTDESGTFLGLLTESSIERRIVDNVLSAKDNA